MNDFSWNAASSWTEPAIARLKELADQYSCSQIATQLNREFRTAFTRNAVIGKLARMGIKKTIVTDTIKPHVPRNRKGNGTGTKTHNLSRIIAIRDKSDVGAAGLPPATSVANTDPVHACTLHGLTNTTCRWPNGEPGAAEFRYCGTPEADLAASRPYCAAHAKISRAMPSPRVKTV